MSTDTTIDDIVTDGFASATRRTDSDELTVRGVAIGEGDISNGLSGKRIRWTGEILQSMEGLLTGRPITLPDSDDPEQHVGVHRDGDGGLHVQGAVPLTSKVGEVTNDRYEPGVGLLFEATVNDPDVTDQIERGLAHVSPVLSFELAQIDDDLYEPTTVHGVRDLGLVSDGAMPSNSIQAVGAFQRMALDALSRYFPSDADVDAMQLVVSDPVYSGTVEDSWDSPTLDGMYNGDMTLARNAALIIRDGGENFTDLSLFVVDGNGNLNLAGLRAAKSRAPQTSGVDGAILEEVQTTIDTLAADEFDLDWGDTEAASVDPIRQALLDDLSLTGATPDQCRTIKDGAKAVDASLVEDLAGIEANADGSLASLTSEDIRAQLLDTVSERSTRTVPGVRRFKPRGGDAS